MTSWVWRLSKVVTLACAVCALTRCSSSPSAQAVAGTDAGSYPGADALLPDSAGIHPDWEPVPLVTAASRARGRSGGEGGQVIRSITIDSTGNFLMMGTDVGGLFRSVDGGTHWEPANVGFAATGVNTMAIDPNDSDRVLLVAPIALDYIHWGGIWLSTDRGLTWHQQLDVAIQQQHLADHDELAWDPTSASGEMSQVAYWSASGSSGGLYKTSDAGLTWNRIQTEYGDGSVACHPTHGFVYVGNASGFYRSTDGGQTFDRTLNGSVTGVGVTKAQPDRVAVTMNRQVWVSNDAGLTFTRKAGAGLPSYGDGLGASGIQVSPVNPDLMLLSYDAGSMYWDRSAFYSHDGGDTWARPVADNSDVFFAPVGADASINGRGRVWHPTDPNVFFITGDWVTKTTDAGAHVSDSSQGDNGVDMENSRWSFNPSNPDLLMFGFQDWGGSFSFDGGLTWTVLDPSSAPKISGYGGYAFSETHLFVGGSPGWDPPRELYTTSDGGKTWVDTGRSSNADVIAVTGDPADPAVAFWSQWRTADQGATWSQLVGCDQVFAYEPTEQHRLFGTSGNTVVESSDHGLTWAPVFDAPGGVFDLAFDQDRNRFYVTVGTDSWNAKLFQWEQGQLTEITDRLPPESDATNSATSAWTVAVDPKVPSVVYAGRTVWLHHATSAVMRSTDAGATWSTLTKQVGGTGIDGGGRMAWNVRVQPATRDVWVAAGVEGIWRYPPP